MAGNLPFSRSIPGGGPPRPFGTDITSVINKVSGKFGSAAHPGAMGNLRTVKSHVNAGESEWKVTVGYGCARWDSAGYERLLHSGLPLWRIKRDSIDGVPQMGGESKFGITDSPDWFLSSTCANAFLRDCETVVNTDLGKYIRGGRFVPRDADDIDALMQEVEVRDSESAHVSQIAEFLRRPENSWRELFSSTGPLRSFDDATTNMKWLCMQGVEQNLHPWGFVEVEPEVRFSSPDNYGYADPAVGPQRITVTVNGTVDIINAWGDEATQFMHLWEVKKRIRDPVTEKLTGIMISHETTTERFYPPEKALYRGRNGLWERGTAHYRGQVLTMLSPGLGGSRLRIAQGLNPDYDARESTDILRSEGGLIRVKVPEPSVRQT
jgi:hypothetical protein